MFATKETVQECLKTYTRKNSKSINLWSKTNLGLMAPPWNHSTKKLSDVCIRRRMQSVKAMHFAKNLSSYQKARKNSIPATENLFKKDLFLYNVAKLKIIRNTLAKSLLDLNKRDLCTTSWYLKCRNHSS